MRILVTNSRAGENSEKVKAHTTGEEGEKVETNKDSEMSEPYDAKREIVQASRVERVKPMSHSQCSNIRHIVNSITSFIKHTNNQMPR